MRKLISKKFDKKQNVLSRTLTSTDLGFSIDTTYVQIIKSPSFESFTFIVEREEAIEGILENYIVTYFNDGHYTQMLTSYPIIESDGDISYDIANGTAKIIIDDSLLFRAGTVECIVPMEEWQPGECYEVNCGGQTGNGQHSPGEPCNASGSDRAYTYCSAGGWVTTGCVYYGTGGGTTTGDGTGTGGNSNNPPDEDEEEEPDDLPVVPFGTKAECKKVNDFLNNTDNAAFKQALNDLANPAYFNENLDVNFEKFIGVYENETTLDYRQGIANQAAVEIPVTPINKYKAFVHTHPNSTQKTYSVFSFDDLKVISNILAKDKLNTGTFVAFLITKKGDNVTKYALTINNKTKFKDFFYSYQDFDFIAASQEEKDKRIDSYEKSEKLRDEYYDNKNPKINDFNVNSEQMLLEFLKFIEEADMGVTLLEAAPTLDGSINNFNTVILDGNTVVRRPCNN